jgi:hypothetical protein
MSLLLCLFFKLGLGIGELGIVLISYGRGSASCLEPGLSGWMEGASLLEIAASKPVKRVLRGEEA